MQRFGAFAPRIIEVYKFLWFNGTEIGYAVKIDVSPEGIGARIQRLRQETGEPLLALARRVQRPSQTIGYWEAGLGRPPSHVLIEFARLAGWDPIYLLTGISAQLEDGFRKAEARRLGVSPNQIRVDRYVACELKDIGKRIALARAAAKLTHSDIGRHLQKSARTVYNWEKGRSEPPPDDLKALEKLLGRDAFWMLLGLEAFYEVDDVIIVAPPRTTTEAVKRSSGRLIPIVDSVEEDYRQIDEYLSTFDRFDPVEQSYYECSSSAFAAIIQTRINEPDLNVGDVVVIDPEVDFSEGDFVLTKRGRLTNIGVLIRDPNGEAFVKGAANHAFPHSLGSWSELASSPKLNKSQRERLPHVVGVVVEHARRKPKGLLFTRARVGK